MPSSTRQEVHPQGLTNESSDACNGDSPRSGIIPIGESDFERIQVAQLDLSAYVVRISGCSIGLRPMEHRLLSLLEKRRNRVVPTTDLVQALYGNIAIDAGRVRLKRLVADIRSRLGTDFAQRLRTVHKIGLVLILDRGVDSVLNQVTEHQELRSHNEIQEF